MDEEENEVFANRDRPVPVLTVTNSDNNASTSEAEPEGKRKRLKQALEIPKMKEKLRDMSNMQEERLETSTSPSLHERLFTK